VSEYKKLEKRFFSYLNSHLVFLKRWIVYSYKRFMQKGREKLTVMLIPHSEKKIFNFQISLFTISFLVLILAGIVASFFISTSRYNLTKKEMDLLENQQEGSVLSMKMIQNEVSSLQNSVMEYKSNVKDIIKLLGASQSENIFGLGGPETEIKNITEIMGLRSKDDYLNEIETIKRINADIAASTKVLQNFTKFLAAREEIIQKIPNNWQGGYGRTIQIQHEYGFQTLYAHCSKLIAYEGKKVKKGEVIAFLGRTGRSTGFHLHYEVRIGTKAVDPMIFMTTEF
jgi:hypothetical protein